MISKVRINKASVFIVFLFLFALYLRCINFATSIQFDSDFGRDSLFAMRILQGDLTLLGPQASVGGFYLGPLYYYGVAAAYAIVGYRTEVVSLAFILMGAATIIIGYIALRRHVSKFAAVLFVLLSVAHPGLVMASRSATNQPMMPLVTVVFMWVYFEATKRQRAVWWLFCGLVFGLFFHVHFSALLVLPAIGILILLQTQGSVGRKITSLVLFALGNILMISPLIVFDMSHGMITSTAFLQYVQASALGQGIADNHPHLSFGEKIVRIAWFSVQHNLLAVIVFATAILELVANQKPIRKNPAIVALVVSSLVSMVVLLKYNGYLYDYYLLIPATILLMTVASLLSLFKAKWFVLGLAVLVCLAHWSMLRYPFAYRIIPNLSQVTDAIKRDIDAQGNRNFTLFKDSSDRLTGIGYEYRFLLARDGYIPVYEQHYELASVLYYIQEEGNKDPLVSTNWETTQFGATKKELIEDVVAQNWKVNVWRLTR